jgi:hypothetical protein
MKSPFPGMDPYIEGCCWGDFHAEFISSWRSAIMDQLPDGFDAEIGQYVSVITPGERSRRDGLVVQSNGASVPRPGAGGVAVLEPVELAFEYLERLHWPFIEVKRLEDETVIAVLELLSPANKSGEDRIEYLRKRESVFRSNAHLIELDLLLGGMRLPMHDDLPPGDFYAFVSRTDRRRVCDVYAWRLQRRLPVIPVPLIPPYPDVQIDLSDVFAATFERGRYQRRLRYEKPPVAPIRRELADWVRKIADLGARP